MLINVDEITNIFKLKQTFGHNPSALLLESQRMRAAWLCEQLDINVQYIAAEHGITFGFENINDYAAFQRHYDNPPNRPRSYKCTDNLSKNSTPAFMQAWEQAVAETAKEHGIDCDVSVEGNVGVIRSDSSEDLAIHVNACQSGRYVNRALDILRQQNPS